MARHKKPVIDEPAGDKLVYPAELRHHGHPRWAAELSTEDMHEAEQSASINTGMTTAVAAAGMRWVHSFRDRRDAEQAWMAGHGFLDEKGHTDWHRIRRETVPGHDAWTRAQGFRDEW